MANVILISPTSTGRLSAMAMLVMAALIFAVIPQCGSAQAPLSKPTQTAVPEPEPSQPETTEAIATEQAEPATVVRTLIDVMAANDGKTIRSLFDVNASQAYGNGTPKSGEAFFRWLDSDIIEREGRVENAQLTVNGNEVVVTGQYQSIGYTSEANFLLTVDNGRITSWQMRY